MAIEAFTGYSKACWNALTWKSVVEFWKSPRNIFMTAGTFALVAKRVEEFSGRNFSSIIHWGRLGDAYTGFVDAYAFMDAAYNLRKVRKSFGYQNRTAGSLDWKKVVYDLTLGVSSAISAGSQFILYLGDVQSISKVSLPVVTFVGKSFGVVANGLTAGKAIIEAFDWASSNNENNWHNENNRLCRMKNCAKAVEALSFMAAKTIGLLVLAESRWSIPKQVQWITARSAGLTLSCFTVASFAMIAIHFLQQRLIVRNVEFKGIRKYEEMLGEKGFFRGIKSSCTWLTEFAGLEVISSGLGDLLPGKLGLACKDHDGAIYSTNIVDKVDKVGKAIKSLRNRIGEIVLAVVKLASTFFASLKWFLERDILIPMKGFSREVVICKTGFSSLAAVFDIIRLSWKQYQNYHPPAYAYARELAINQHTNEWIARWFEIASKAGSFALNFFGLCDALLQPTRKMNLFVYTALATWATTTGLVYFGMGIKRDRM
jgi:hypothetical protein